MSQTLFTTQTPGLLDVFENSQVTVGTTLKFDTSGTVSGVRFYAPATIGPGTFEATFWVITTDDNTGTGTGTLLANVSFGALTPGAWNTAAFAPVSVDAAHVYVAAVRTSQGRYTATAGFFTSQLVNLDITGIQDGSAAAGFTKLFNGRFISNITGYPNQTFGSNGYFVDVLFDPATSGLQVNLTATGSMSAALANEVHLSAALTATGGMSASMRVETTLRAALTATGGMSAALSVPSGPVDPVGSPVAMELLTCFTAQLQQLPSPPRYIQLRVGQDTGPLVGANVDECCAGLAWVRIANIYPSWDSFPAPDNDWLPCGPLAYAVVLEMGVAFCMPWSDSDDSFDNQDPPNATDWATAFQTQMQHQTLMRRTAACCWLPTQRRAVGEWTPLPVEAGCTGGKMLVTVSVMAPCGDC